MYNFELIISAEEPSEDDLDDDPQSSEEDNDSSSSRESRSSGPMRAPKEGAFVFKWKPTYN
jgi:hypothetical protein